MSKTLNELKRDLRYYEGYTKGLQEAFKILEKVIKEKKILYSKEGETYNVRHARE